MGRGPVPFRYIDRDGMALYGVKSTEFEALEGFYYSANSAQTGMATPANATFTNTAPYLTIFNANPLPQGGTAGNPGTPTTQNLPCGVNILPDYIRLTPTAAGGAASGLVTLNFALYIDTINRYSSGGSQLTPNNLNPNSQSQSNATIYAGPVVATAPSAAAYAAVGNGILRPAVSGTVGCVLGDQFIFDFGSMEGGLPGTITVASPIQLVIPMPGLVVPPQCTALLYIWYNGATTPAAASFTPELGWFER